MLDHRRPPFCEEGTIWLCKDNDGDLVCDEKEPIAQYIRGNLEHALNGLVPTMDNWVYNAKEGLRLRRVDGKWITDQTNRPRTMGSDAGRLRPPLLQQQRRPDPRRSGSHLFACRPHEQSAGECPALSRSGSLADPRKSGINRGYDPSYLRPDGTMINANSNCGPVVYRGDNLPAELHGNIFINETVGNLVRRQVLVEDENGMYSVNAYAEEHKEFIASTDERFRPVNMFNAPDGTLYLLDMYRGVVQQGDLITPYLRNQIIERGLEQPINLGRIYGIVHGAPNRAICLSAASVDELVTLLSHPNGWHRDMAQQLLVQHGDLSVTRQPWNGSPPRASRREAVCTPSGHWKDLTSSARCCCSIWSLTMTLTSELAQIYLMGRVIGPDPSPAVLIEELIPLSQDESNCPAPFRHDGRIDRQSDRRRGCRAGLERGRRRYAGLLQALLAGFAGQEVEFLAARIKHSSWAEPET